MAWPGSFNIEVSIIILDNIASVDDTNGPDYYMEAFDFLSPDSISDHEDYSCHTS